MKNFYKYFFTILTILISLSFIGCNNIQNQNDEIELKNQQNMICLSVIVNQTSSRTIFPQDVTKSQITKAELKAKLHNEVDFSNNWTFNSIDELSDSAEISLPSAAYDFELNLYTTRNNSFIICQTASLNNEYISYSNSSLVFKTQYVFQETGNAQITLTWNTADRVTSVKAGLFTIESKGESAVEGYPLEELTISNTETECTACYSKLDVPGGNYFIRFELYAQNGMKINTLEDIIYISHYADTIKTIPLSNVNTVYTINYDLRGSQLQDITLTVNRNKNKAIFLPTDKEFTHPDPSKAFLGWYYEPDYSGERITAINAGDSGDKTVYARWEEIKADNIEDVVTLMETSREIKVKKNEELSEELISSVGKKIKDKKNLYIELNLSEATISSIGINAFMYCSCLSKIVLPEGLTTIKYYAFYASGLTEIILPESLKEIQFCALEDTKLTEIILPESIEKISSEAFPSTLTTIYFNCKNLSATSDTFKNCNNLTIFIGNSVEKYNSCFKNCTTITKLVLDADIPNSSIENAPFSGCTNLNTIEFGSNVRSIGKNAFAGVTSNKKLIFHDNIPQISNETYYGETIFGNVSSIEYNKTFQNWITDSRMITKTITTPFDLYLLNDNSELEKLTNLILPETMTEIPDYAFSQTKIESVTFHNKLLSIGSYAFYNCINLSTITIPDSVTDIKTHAFSNCSNLSSIKLPSKITTINSYVFHNCTKLTSISLPEKITSIDNRAFSDCQNLTTINFPEGLLSIGQSCFANCTKLNNITLPDSITTLGNKCFEKCEGLETITVNCNLPDDYTDSRDSPFYNCSNIQNIIFGNQITSIGKYNFYGLTSLKSLSFTGKIPSINAYNFSSSSEYNLYYNGTLKDWMTNAKEIVKKINNYNLYLNDEKISKLDITDEGITEIPDYAFYKCKSLEQFFIRTDKLETIGNYAFYGCTELYNGSLVEGIKTIGDYAFSGCTNYNKNSRMNIPSTVVNFGKHVFDGCINLNNITVKCKLPEATNKNDSAFYGAVLTQIAFEYDIPAYALYDQNSLEYVSMTSNVTKIGDYAFYNCQNLKLLKPDPEFFLPIGLENIGDCAFKQCYALTAITLPRTITSIGKCAFESCTNLVTVNLKCDMPSFANNTEAPFTGCTKFEILNIINKDEYTVKSIGNYAFYKSNIKEINFPSSVKKFGVSSFASCEYLKTITLNSVPQQISSNAFKEVTGELKFGSDETLNFFNKATYYKDPDKTKTCNLQGNYYLNYNTWKIEETLDKYENRNETLIRLN